MKGKASYTTRHPKSSFMRTAAQTHIYMVHRGKNGLEEVWLNGQRLH